MTKLNRVTVGAMVTLDVHARDEVWSMSLERFCVWGESVFTENTEHVYSKLRYIIQHLRCVNVPCPFGTTVTVQVTNLVQKRVDSPDDFAWLSQLRYYWQACCCP